MILVPLADSSVPWKKGLGVWGVMAACGLATLPLLGPSEAYVQATGLDRDTLLPHTFLTHILVHGSFGHLAGNMLFLWSFGMRIHHRLGWWRFLAAFAGAGVAGGAAFLLEGSSLPLVGASGAISGLMGLYGVLWPTSRLRIFAWFGKGSFWKPRAYWALAFWFLLQIFLARQKSAADQVAYSAHIGGFLTGVATGVALRMRARRKRSRDRWLLEDPDEGQISHARDLLAAVTHNLAAGHADAARRAWDEWKTGPAHATPVAPLEEIAARFPRHGDAGRAKEAAEWAALLG